MDKKIEPVSTVCEPVRQEDVCLSSPGVEMYVKVAVIGILIYVYFYEAVMGVVGKWFADPSWSHGFLIPVFSLYFLSQHKKDILSLTPRTDYLGLFLLIFCLVFHPLNIVHFKVGYFQPLTAIAAVGACVLFFGGWKLVRYTWLPVVYLIFAVPLPDRFLYSATMPLRLLAAKVSAVALSLYSGVEATARGTVVDVIHNGRALDSPLDVALACSGMRLLMTFVALGVAMAYLHYRPAWQRLVLLACTIPIAVICNIVRVTITGFIFVLGNAKYATGIYHDLLGLLMLPLAFGLYGGVAWFMENLLENDSVSSGEVGVVANSGDDVIVRRRNDQ
ncbi:MAG: exosortase/archaeosortase family protein [Planctomycetes bacterium]|nr:exosortase/archaeosortase family protein [Planctomycetota bacterium]